MWQIGILLLSQIASDAKFNIQNMKQAHVRWRIVDSRLSILIVFLSVFIVYSTAVQAQDSYSPYTTRNYPSTVYWGDTHLHTKLSFDAYRLANRLPPDDAYRFARGETVTASNGMRTRLHRPLDFLVVADHAEAMGVLSDLEDGDSVLLSTNAGRRMLRRFKDSTQHGTTDPRTFQDLLMMGKEYFWPWSRKQSDLSMSYTQSVWRRVTATADRYNDPSRFTAFIGYEWSSTGNARGNLHRVVIFKDGAKKVNQVLPFSASDSSDPEALWTYLAQYEQKTGGEVLAIPHNGNLSNGEMFSLLNFAGEPLTRSYAASRSRWEPLYEVTQMKGDSEAHPFLSPTDEFADYETWNSWQGKSLPAGREWNEAEKVLKEGEYARSAFKRGLALQVELGVNPFKFGMIGSTDSHVALSAVEEDNFWGELSNGEPSANRLTQEVWPGAESTESWQYASSGYAALWATENTREALFAAMKRREAYATTGTRMTVRFFGGWSYEKLDAFRPDLVRIGYTKGVPMGGDLTNAPGRKAPTFLVCAVKDPDGASLDRIQIIKGWRTADGDLRERIYNVALSDGRRVGSDGKAAIVGSTVDVKNATYTNTIGSPELATVWTDPDFDAEQLAFYYARVIEIPTPRWTAYDAKYFRLRGDLSYVPMTTQERAYTSPIWYTP